MSALSILVACALNATAMPQATPAPPDARHWTVVYAVSGGIDGRIQVLTLDDGGALVARDERRKQQSSSTAPPDLVSAVAAFVRDAKPLIRSKPEAAPYPDALAFELRVKTGGRDYAVTPTREIGDRLSRALRDGLRAATPIAP